MGGVGVKSLQTFLTLNTYLLSFLQEINDVLDHGVFRVSFVFSFNAAYTYKDVQVLQMNNYFSFPLSESKGFFFINPPPPFIKNA